MKQESIPHKFASILFNRIIGFIFFNVYILFHRIVRKYEGYLSTKQTSNEVVNYNSRMCLPHRFTINVKDDASRLHISKSAKMEDTHFNTNCGDIYIGDYTFCGGFVKIITGSHDYKRVGKERQLSVPTSGNDIHIGNGVWLCANATILGPCRIHDNAVIAAGAVVIPGTEVPKNTIWGAPAKHIKTIELSIHS